jgi:hypothetical protein
LIVRFTKSDFYLGTATPIAIRQKLPVVIMFYIPNEIQSIKLARIFRETSKQVSQFIFAAVDASANGEREVMQAFALNADSDGPLSEFKIDGFPTILVYRKGWPKAFYNEQWSVSALRNWLLKDAIRQDYRNPILTHHGILSYGNQTADDRQQAQLLDQQSYQYTQALFEEIDNRSVSASDLDASQSQIEIQQDMLQRQLEDNQKVAINESRTASLGVQDQLSPTITTDPVILGVGSAVRPLGS